MNEGRRNLLKGTQAEAFAVNKLIQMGISVSMPVFKQCKYDCIVDDGERVFKTQIKKISEDPQTPNSVKAKLSSGHYDSSGNMNSEFYKGEDIDAFLFVDLEEENCFWMLFDETPKTSITISYKRSKYASSENYYRDYLIENRFDGIEMESGSETEDLSGSIFDY